MIDSIRQEVFLVPPNNLNDSLEEEACLAADALDVATVF